MKYLLDTNICIFIINHRPQQTRERFARVRAGDIAISSVTLSELQYGVAKSANPAKNQNALRHFLIPLDVLPYTAAAAEEYGRLRRHLEPTGQPIGPMDLMIAAHALAERLVLVTNNRKEFARVPGLLIEDWSVPID